MKATAPAGIVRIMTKNRNALLTAAGLALCAVGIVLQIATGADGYPTVPPGVVITVVGALLVAFVSWRFMPIVGLLVGAFISVGAFVTPNTGDRLGAPGDFGPFLGTVVQIIGLAMAVIFGIVATVQAFRRSEVSSAAAG